jgi:DNA-binding LacI/PurR family transcriptional regulator
MRLRRYHEISDELEQQIRTGARPAGEYLPSERELSQHYVVNRATVRRALAQLAEKGLVEVRPARGAFVRASEPHSGNGNAAHPLLALVAYASAGSPLMLDVFHAAQLAAQAAGYDLLFYSTHSEDRFEAERREAAWLEHCLTRGVDGLMLWHAGGPASHPILRRLQAEGFPLVLLDRRVEGLAFDFVGIDHLAAGYMATEHLIRMGHRAVGHITHPMKLNSVAERRRGYERALRDYGLPMREEWIDFTDDRPANYRDAGIRRVLEAEPRPTALFAVSDRTALRALREAFALGLRVPEDVALVGVDDIPAASTAAVPLTTVRQPFQAMGERAIERLLARIGGAAPVPETMLLPAELVVRESTDIGMREQLSRSERVSPEMRISGARV